MTMRRAVGLPDVPGLLVHNVTASSLADDFGFRKGDLINAIESQPLNSLSELRKILNKIEPRTKRVLVLRGAERIELKLKTSTK